jgi:hypothetical protein
LKDNFVLCFIDEVIKRVKTVHDVARSNVELTQSKNKEYYDKKTKLPNFKGGDRVFLKIEKVEIGKKKVTLLITSSINLSGA